MSCFLFHCWHIPKDKWTEVPKVIQRHGKFGNDYEYEYHTYQECCKCGKVEKLQFSSWEACLNIPEFLSKENRKKREDNRPTDER